MLQLQIGFPTGRYCAASHANPRDPEWPPHPSRVYSALVAGAYGGKGCLEDAERQALDRLATAGAPALAFPDADVTPSPDSYVPVNDEKSRLTAGISRGVLEPSRQVRQFPSAYLLGVPEVSLYWDVDMSAADILLLDRLAARMTHLGTSHSFVTARFRAAVGSPALRWIPDVTGRDYLRVPVAGRLDELDRKVAQRTSPGQRDVLRRSASLCEVLMPYRPADRTQPAVTPARHDWMAFRVEGASWGADTAHTLARAARRALMALLGDAVPEALHGHNPAVEHLAWLPLPDVGHRQARGRIRGLAVGFPRSLPPADLAVLVRGLQRLQLLHLPDGQTARITPVVETQDTPKVLRGSTWCRASRTWATVTPVILDRPPKRAEADLLVKALADSLVIAGHPMPVALKLSRTSDFDGAPAALDVPTRLPRYHATVRFAEAVEGPVLAGRWRNFGIGLFRATDEGEPT